MWMDRTPTILVALALLVGFATAVHYWHQVQADEIAAVERQTMEQLDEDSRHRYLAYRAHEVAPSAALAETIKDRERLRFSHELTETKPLPLRHHKPLE